MTDKAKPRVYYNSACPVCRAGIRHQRRKMQHCEVSWIDIHTDLQARGELDADTEFVRERLHVIDGSTQLHVGIDAFIALWQYSPGERWKARLFTSPLVHPLARLAYNGFARLLYRCNWLLKHW